jgi:hypothetical protein
VRLIPKKAHVKISIAKCDENLLSLLRKTAEGTRPFGKSSRL